MAALEQRVKKLEELQPKQPQRVSRFIRDEKESTPDELVLLQAQIDEAEARGDFVIIREIVDPPFAWQLKNAGG